MQLYYIFRLHYINGLQVVRKIYAQSNRIRILETTTCIKNLDLLQKKISPSFYYWIKRGTQKTTSFHCINNRAVSMQQWHCYVYFPATTVGHSYLSSRNGLRKNTWTTLHVNRIIPGQKKCLWGEGSGRYNQIPFLKWNYDPPLSDIQIRMYERGGGGYFDHIVLWIIQWKMGKGEPSIEVNFSVLFFICVIFCCLWTPIQRTSPSYVSKRHSQGNNKIYEGKKEKYVS